MTIRELEKKIPSLFALLTTKNANGSQVSNNVMAISWWTISSNNPPRIIACVGKRSLSNENIARDGIFALNLMNEKYSEIGIECGSASGRVKDKISEFGLDVQESENGIPLIKEANYSLECKVAEIHESGDHSVFLADVINVVENKNEKVLLAFDGYSSLKSI